MPHAADPHQPSSFGRGWIPASRDIGLPGDSWPNAAIPLPQAGGLRGGHSPVGEVTFGFREEEGRAHPRPLPPAGGEKLRDALPPAGG